MTEIEKVLMNVFIPSVDISKAKLFTTNKYGRKNAKMRLRIVKKPKVYAWDKSATKEQKKLEKEQEEVLYVQYFIKQLPHYRIGRRSGKSMIQWSLIELLLKYNVVLENK